MKLPKYIKAVIAATVLTAIGAIYLQKTFLTFLVGWLIAVPIVVMGYMLYGLREYRKQRKNSIIVSVKPNSITEKYAEMIRKEEEIRIEKEVLYKELKKSKKGI